MLLWSDCDDQQGSLGWSQLNRWKSLHSVYYVSLVFRASFALTPNHMHDQIVCDDLIELCSQQAGNAEACNALLGTKLGPKSCKRFAKTWQLESVDGKFSLPPEIGRTNPLLEVMWSRFQEGCRLCSSLGKIQIVDDDLSAEQLSEIVADSCRPIEHTSPRPFLSRSAMYEMLSILCMIHPRLIC